MIGGQRIQVGLPHAGKTAEVTIDTDSYQISVEDGAAITAAARPAVTSGGTRPPPTSPLEMYRRYDAFWPDEAPAG